MRTVSFTVHDDIDTANAAGGAYFWRAFRVNNLRNFIIVAIMSSGGIVAALKYKMPAWVTVEFAAFLTLMVVYIPAMYFGRRWEAAKFVKKSPERHVVITDEDISIRAGERTVTLPWNKIHALWEYPNFLLLARSRFSYWWLPKASIPTEALGILRGAQGRFTAFRPLFSHSNPRAA